MRLCRGLAAAWLVGGSSGAWAAGPDAPAPQGAAVEAPAPVAPAPPADQPKPGSSRTEFTLQSSDGRLRLRLGGYVQADGRFYLHDEGGAATDTFLLRRARLAVSGEVGPRFSFFLRPDFGEGEASLEDAWGEVRVAGPVRLRVGKTKQPVGLELLHSSSALPLVERGLPSQLVANRDIGVMLHGELASGRVLLAVGVFNGANDGTSLDRDANDAKEKAGRILVRPFRRRAGALDLGLGMAGSYGTHEGLLSGYRTPSRVPFFTYAPGATAAGRRWRLAPQAFAYQRSVGLLVEWTRSSLGVRRGAVVERLAHTARGALVSLVVTGEAASPSGVKPRRPFDPGTRAWGALEVAARVGELRFDERAFVAGLADPAAAARRARSVGVGLHWYLTEQLKWSAAYERTSFVGGAAGPADRRPTQAVLLRLQIVF